MKGKFWRKVLAAALALLIVSGGVPIQPVSQLFERTAITAEAAQTTLTYTFKKDSNIYSYIVYNNTERKLSNDYFWNTGTAQFDDMTITITGSGVNVDTMSTDDQNETGYTYCVPMKATYTFSSTSKYITHVKIYAITGDKEINDNRTQSCSVSVGSQAYKIEVTLSDTPPVSTYNINYELNGGTNASSNPATYDDDKAVTLANPTRTGYTFGGWYDNASFSGSPVTNIPEGSSGDKTLYAKWTINEYTITWKNYNGTILGRSIVEYGKTPSYGGKIPTKPSNAQYSYTFKGWSPAIKEVTGDQTYTAQFSSTVNAFTVTWKNGDTTLEEDTNVPYGTTPTYDGLTPTKEDDTKYSYEFSGWSPEVSKVTGNTEYNAVYAQTPKTYNVTYMVDDEVYGEVETVAYGTELTPREIPVKTGHTFSGWSEIPETMPDKDVVIRGTFAQNNYNIAISDGIANGSVSSNKTTAHYGDNVTLTVDLENGYYVKSIKAGSAEVTENADGTYSFKMPAEDVTVSAEFEKQKFTVTWKNGDTILEADENVTYGTTPTYNGEAPTKTADAMYTYSFAGWSPEISDVTGNVTYTAQFSSTAKSYTITYKVDGEIYKTESVSYGNSITLPDAPTREGYTFSGWQTSYTTMPASDIEITGSFKADIAYSNVYFNLTHNTYTGSEISPVFTVSYGDTVLTENTDFVVESGNTGTAADTYTLTLTGTGAYTGTLTAEWYIDPVKNYHVTVTNGTIMGDSDYEEQAVVTVVGNTEVGGWYNGDTLVSAEQTYSFYAVSDVDLEWRADDAYAAEKAEEGIANITISPRIINSNGKTTVTVTSTWTLPEGAEIIQAGTYRYYVDKGTETPNSEYMIANGTFYASSLTECKGTFYFNINMGVVSAARKLCTMTYVTYTLNGETYTITSDVAYSEAE